MRFRLRIALEITCTNYLSHNVFSWRENVFLMDLGFERSVRWWIYPEDYKLLNNFGVFRWNKTLKPNFANNYHLDIEMSRKIRCKKKFHKLPRKVELYPYQQHFWKSKLNIGRFRRYVLSMHASNYCLLFKASSYYKNSLLRGLFCKSIYLIFISMLNNKVNKRMTQINKYLSQVGG